MPSLVALFMALAAIVAILSQAAADSKVPRDWHEQETACDAVTQESQSDDAGEYGHSLVQSKTHSRARARNRSRNAQTTKMAPLGNSDELPDAFKDLHDAFDTHSSSRASDIGKVGWRNFKVIRELQRLRCDSGLQWIEAFLIFTTMVGGWHWWGLRSTQKQGMLRDEVIHKSMCDLLLLNSENTAFAVCSNKDKAVCGEVLQPQVFDDTSSEEDAKDLQTEVEEPRSTLRSILAVFKQDVPQEPAGLPSSFRAPSA
mmetsp:Transcript_13073/g.29715  ORF Transcript_13073/g.29715 Transcript_13073/m.29715 type:complete len:257 (+) Transcript_13073:103-873(+)